MLQRSCPRNVAPALADDSDQFALIIQLLRKPGPDDGSMVADQTRIESGEASGIVRRLEAALTGMVHIIKSDADDLLRLVNGREKLDRAQIDFSATG